MFAGFAFFLFISLTVLVVVIGVIIPEKRRYSREVDANWSRLAEKIGARYHPPRGPWYNMRLPQIVMRVDDCRVVVQASTIWINGNPTRGTLVQSSAQAPFNLTIVVSPRSTASSQSRPLPSPNDSEKQDIPTALDIRSESVELLPLWIRPEIRDLMVRAPEYEYSLKRCVARATRQGLEKNPEDLIQAMRAVSRLARQGSVLLEEWRELAQHLNGSLESLRKSITFSESTMIHATWHGVPITINLMKRHDSAQERKILCTRVCGKRHAAERFQTTKGPANRRPDKLEAVPIPAFSGLKLFSEDPTRTAKRFSPLVQELLGQVRPIDLLADERLITLYIEGFVSEKQHIEQAVQVVGELCSEENVSPYR